MANEGFNPEDFREYEERLAKILDLQNRATDGLKGYNTILKDIKEVARNLKTIKEQESRLSAEIENREKKRQRLIAKSSTLQGKNKKLVEAEVRELEKEIAARKEGLKYAKQKTSVLQENAAILAESANSGNLLSASFVSTGRGAIGLYKSLKGMSKELLKEMKAVQMTEQSMGLLNKNADAFRLNMYKAAGSTTQLGINAGDLAKMQGSYSEQIGRSVILSEQGLIAMGEMAKGTMLGVEGTSEMVANLDNFGISAMGAHKVMEDMMNTSTKMGVNSVKVTSNLKKNLQLANKFHFKDGVKGMIRLAASAAKVRVNMDGIASMADRVFRPEGAVEMASRLQTMGGEFSKLADPFTLMFKARNDFEGFTNDLINASKEFSVFNKETGEFDISGLGYDKIKEIADITGMAASDIAQMSKDAAKLDKIKMNIGGGITDDDNKEFISSIASFNQATKQYEVTIGNKEISINKLTDSQIKIMRDEKESLKERAKQAQTFDETWKNMKNTFKSLLFPMLNGLSEGLKDPLNKFMDWAHNSGGFDRLFESAKKIGKTIGEFLEGATKLATVILDNPLKSGIMALIGSSALWVLRGRMLGIGFNTVASSGGMGGLMGGKGGMLGRAGGMRGMGRLAKAGYAGGGFGGAMKGIGRGIGRMGGGPLGLVGVAGSMGLDYARSGMDDPNSTGGKALGVGSSALSGAGYGAMIGSIIPGIGTAIGAAIGGLAGAAYGAFNEYKDDMFENKGAAISNISTKQSFDDVIIRSGQAPIGINPADDIMSVKKDGPVDKALGNGKGVSGDVNVKFNNSMKIDGKLTLVGADGGQADIKLDDPVLLRNLSSLIQQELSKAINGGKMSPNPS